MHADLERVFNPRSVAVIGASRREGTIGNQVTKNLIEGKYPGPIYPINPGADEICGLKAYPSIGDAPGPVDAAVYCIPADKVLEVARQCAKAGVKGHIVITSGFGEVGKKREEQELVAIVREAGGRLFGPNIVGFASNSAKANASFAPCLPFPGHTALISQSGALIIALDTVTFVRRFGLSAMVSLGNMADIDFTDCIQFYAQDPNTRCIALYIEGLRDGFKFIEAGRVARKPIVAVKAGVSAHGAAAAASHTGSLAGSSKVYEAAFKQAQVVQAASLDDLLNKGQALAMQPPLRGDNIVLITNGGGIGVLATDAAEKHGVPLQTCPPKLQEEFRKHMPDYGSPRNPVDITGGTGVAGYEGALRLALEAPWAHGIGILYCETAVTKPLEIAEAVIKIVKESRVRYKPIVACFVGGERSTEAAVRFGEASIPCYDCPDKAMSAFSALRQHARFEAEGCQPDFVPFKDVHRARAQEVIAGARSTGRTALTEPEAKEIFGAYGLPVMTSTLARTERDAVRAAEAIGYPVVLKIVSPDIVHKSDAGGVKVNLRDAQAVRGAYQAILHSARQYNPDADIHGVLVYEMAPQGMEVICGSTCDPQFGPTVMFGLGGIFVEVLKDVTFRVAPISERCGRIMMSEIRCAAMLEGVRGDKRRDQEAVATVLSRLSQLVTELEDEIAETDANPIMVYEEGRGCRVVDARIILKKK